MAKELIGPVKMLVLLQFFGVHKRHGTYVALEVILLYGATTLCHMLQVDLLLEEHLLAALTNRQALRGSFRLQLAPRITKRVL